jgi:hypothetical protein
MTSRQETFGHRTSRPLNHSTAFPIRTREQYNAGLGIIASQLVTAMRSPSQIKNSQSIFLSNFLVKYFNGKFSPNILAEYSCKLFLSNILNRECRLFVRTPTHQTFEP